ncbi:MAG: type II secretion system F family protein [Candidatus Omnitrophica bacterium]|nr:type II secretion system F family protein [Candidatus Omnitrophota bacterium]
MLIVGYIIIIAAFGYIFYLLGSAQEKETVSLSAGSHSQPVTIVFLRGFAPLNKIILGSALRNYGQKLNNKISILRWNIKAEEFFSSKELLAIFLPLFLYLFEVASPLFLGAAALIGFALPDLYLNMQVKKLKEAISRSMPEIVDLLALCVGGGLNFMAAMRWVIEKSKSNPLIEQFKFVLEEISVGKSRIEALKDMSKRLTIPDITSFVRILVQTEKLGTPVEEAFKIISDDSRMRRRHRGERQAMKAPMKMLIPLILCILPIILIIIGGPIMLRFLKGGLFDLGV